VPKLDRRLLLLGAAGAGLWLLSRQPTPGTGSPGSTTGRYPFQGQLADGRVVTVTGPIAQSITRDDHGNVRPLGFIGQAGSTFVEVVAG
jgi:hypothetical protein